MNAATFLGLLNNVALLMALGLLYDTVAHRRRTGKPSPGEALTGVAIGALGLAVMLNPWQFIPGVVFDTRSVLLGLAGLFFGSLSTLVACLMTAVFRLYQGGGGAFTGVLTIFVSGAIGLAWRHLRRGDLEDISIFEIYFFGVAAHVAVLLCFLTLPRALEALSHVALPVMIIYPVGTALLGRLLANRLGHARADEVLRASEEKFRLVSENAEEGIVVVQDEKIKYANPLARRFFDATAEQIAAGHYLDFTHPDDRGVILDRYQRRAVGEQVEGRAVFRLVTTQGQTTWVEGHTTIFTWEGRPATLVFLTDITDRRRAEEELRESERRLERAELVSLSGNWEFDLTSDTGHASKGAQQVYGLYKSQWKSDDIKNIPLPEYRAGLDGAMRGLIKNAKPYDLEFKIKKPATGEIVDIHAITEYDPERKVVFGVIQDITGRKRAEEGLRESERRYRQLVETANEGIWSFDKDFRTIYLNKGMAEILEYSVEEATGKKFTDFVPPEDIPDIKMRQDRRRRGLKEVLERRLLTRTGQTKWAIFSVAPIMDKTGQFDGVLAMVTDVTERKRAEQEKEKLHSQLRQAQKMEAIGTLAGGIAHDFNNILAVIVGYTELAQMEAKERGEDAPELTHVLRAAERARDLVKQILTFSRKGRADLQPLNLNRSVSQTLELLRRTLPKMVEIQTHLGGDLRLVKADTNQMEQVLLNLAANASDAMPEGGRLVIETRNIVLGQDYCQRHLEVKPGPYVLLEVSDTGCGMDQRTREQIFDPFFTTKEVGKGTGLGLSTVYGIVKAHDGHIDCHSQPGQGTTFEIYLPAQPEQPAPAAGGDEPSPGSLRGRETILLVDDEEALRHLGTRTLEGLGYQVITAKSGEEALEIYGQMNDRPDLVVLDLNMPGMGGHRCLEEILAIDPKAKVIIASGYSADGLVWNPLSSGALGFVAKPFRRVDLLATVRDVLDGKNLGS